MALASRTTCARVLGGLLVAASAVACNSDLILDDPVTTTTTDDPVTTAPPDPWDFTTSTGDPTTGDEGDLSCRGAIACLVNCALNIPANPGPEVDLSCFLECQEGMSAEEVYHLFNFVNCVTNLCIDQELCEEDLGGDECNGCLLNNLAADEPPGCEAVGLACRGG